LILDLSPGAGSLSDQEGSGCHLIQIRNNEVQHMFPMMMRVCGSRSVKLDGVGDHNRRREDYQENLYYKLNPPEGGIIWRGSALLFQTPANCFSSLSSPSFKKQCCQTHKARLQRFQRGPCWFPTKISLPQKEKKISVIFSGTDIIEH
jgi:hypothetical protein